MAESRVVSRKRTSVNRTRCALRGVGTASAEICSSLSLIDGCHAQLIAINREDAICRLRPIHLHAVDDVAKQSDVLLIIDCALEPAVRAKGHPVGPLEVRIGIGCSGLPKTTSSGMGLPRYAVWVNFAGERRIGIGVIVGSESSPIGETAIPIEDAKHPYDRGFDFLDPSVSIESVDEGLTADEILGRHARVGHVEQLVQAEAGIIRKQKAIGAFALHAPDLISAFVNTN
ncbi:hypothetical protein QRQ56_33475 [Bradyrhizobium sp. U531]|uniref:hypothetical protein n=1 Tax=Bradyrhizobium sp. U531 TaxID=3053458 RepID=UPI003F428A51